MSSQKDNTSGELLRIQIIERAVTDDGQTIVRNDNLTYEDRKNVKISSESGTQRLPSEGKEITLSGETITVRVGSKSIGNN